MRLLTRLQAQQIPPGFQIPGIAVDGGTKLGRGLAAPAKFGREDTKIVPCPGVPGTQPHRRAVLRLRLGIPSELVQREAEVEACGRFRMAGDCNLIASTARSATPALSKVGPGRLQLSRGATLDSQCLPRESQAVTASPVPPSRTGPPAERVCLRPRYLVGISPSPTMYRTGSVAGSLSSSYCSQADARGESLPRCELISWA